MTKQKLDTPRGGAFWFKKRAILAWCGSLAMVVTKKVTKHSVVVNTCQPSLCFSIAVLLSCRVLSLQVGHAQLVLVLTLTSSLIRHAVMAERKRRIVRSYFTAVNENIANCDMCRKLFTTVAPPQSYLNQ